MPDPLRLTIAYLRLWKACDLQLSKVPMQDSARLFEVVAINEAQIVSDLRLLADSDLDWADEPEGLRSDIATVLDLWDKGKNTEKEIAAIDALRKQFQKKALQYSGDIEIAAGGTASGD